MGADRSSVDLILWSKEEMREWLPRSYYSAGQRVSTL